MNLTIQPPRRPSNLSILGIANLARMTDKARATRTETEGEYVYGMESGLDESLLTFLGISEADFADAAENHTDEELAEWISKIADKSEDEIQTFNNDILNREPQSKGARTRLKTRIDQYAPERTDVKTVTESIEIEDWGIFRTVDLTTRPPRTPYDRSIAGIYGLMRVADKARAAKADKLNGYIYNCPIDQAIFSFLDITAEDFQEAAYHNVNNIELSNWVHNNTKRTQAEISHFNYDIAHKGPDTDELQTIFNQVRDRVAPGRIDITAWFDLLDLDDEQDYGIVDLTRHAPRSPYNTSLMGLMGLARLIDKGRAKLSHSLGDYLYGRDSLLDSFLLRFLEISASDFLDMLKKNTTDEAVVSALHPKSEEDIAKFNADLSSRSPRTRAQTSWFKGRVKGLDPHRPDLATLLALVQLDDQIAFARQKAGV